MSTKSSNFIEQILNSIFYKRATGKAGGLLQNPARLFNLLKNALSKAGSDGSNDTLGKIRAKLTLVVRLVRNYASGEYRDISRGSIISVVAALIYFVSPIDFIPDFIPMLGFADDLALLTFVLGKLNDELERFQLWEMNKDLN